VSRTLPLEADRAAKSRAGCGFLLEPELYGRLIVGDHFTTLPPAEFIRAWTAQRAIPVQLFTGHGRGAAPASARVWRVISTERTSVQIHRRFDA
jgi:hypothetical protein